MNASSSQTAAQAPFNFLALSVLSEHIDLMREFAYVY